MTREEVSAFVSALISMRDNATDAQALKAIRLYPEWKANKNVKAGQRLRWSDKLYKVKEGKDHTTQADWTPDVATSMFEVINETHAGTADDPIPYDGNMVLKSGKYYIQNDLVYLCTRDTGIAVYNALSELVGLYVEPAV